VSCGDAHTALLTDAGAVVLAGCNGRGACGVPPDVASLPHFHPVKLGNGAAAAALSAGGHNTAVVTAGRVVRVFDVGL
jgi:hypothetical protein